jgi:chromate transporter
MNAVVVGVLLAALISPLWTSTVRGVGDVVVAAGAFGLLVVGKAPAWVVVLLVGVGSLVVGMVAG